MLTNVDVSVPRMPKVIRFGSKFADSVQNQANSRNELQLGVAVFNGAQSAIIV